MGAYPPATHPPAPAGWSQPPPRRRRVKPLVLALILGGIVGAGGATAFAVSSFGHSPTQLQEAPAAATSSTVAAFVGTERGVPARLAEPVRLGQHVTVRGHVSAGLHVFLAHARVDDADHVHDTDHLYDADHVHDTHHVGIDVDIRAGQHACVVWLDFVGARVHVGELGHIRPGLPASPSS